jgi:DNA-binding response OmpR family regulator
MAIMIIDDDFHILELVGTLLKNAGYTVCEAGDGKQALDKLAVQKIDLCVLDVMMPNMDGYTFCVHAKKYYPDLPILMLTAKGETDQKVKGFGLGADDYLVKPFEGAELTARVAALLKRYKINLSQCLQLGKVTLDRTCYTVRTANKTEDIPMKEFELLFKLGGQAGRTFSRDTLIEDLWGYDFNGNERTLDVHINRLRERFDENVCGFKITTVRGLGYRLEVKN